MQELIRVLLQAKMGFAALPICGIFIGLFISSTATSFDYKLTYECIGLGVTVASTILFIIVCYVYAFSWMFISAWANPERPQSETVGAKPLPERRS
jgi:hypothetical protein